MIWILLTVISAVILIMYGFLIIGFIIGWMRIKDVRVPAEFQPQLLLSVIVPFRNEQSNMTNLLKDILAQDYPHSLMEIILVDDHSEDDTTRIIREFFKANKIAIRSLLLNTDQGNGTGGSKKKALERGIFSATGKWIVVTDADCRIPPRWLKNFAYLQSSGNYKMIAGPVMLSSGTIMQKLQSLEFLSLVATAAGGIGIGRPFMCNGANLGFEREAFKAAGGYSGNLDIASGDDVFLLHKFNHSYGPSQIGFLKSAEAIVTTEAAPGLLSFFKQRIRWAGKARYYKDGFTKYIAVLVFFMNSVILMTTLAGIFFTNYLILAISLLMVKVIIDLPIIYSALKFFRIPGKIFLLYLPLSVIYPLYITATGILSLVFKMSWKGRR